MFPFDDVIIGILHRYYDNRTIAPAPMKQPYNTIPMDPSSIMVLPKYTYR